MSLFFGVYMLDPAAPVPDSWKKWVRTNLARKGHGTAAEYADGGFFLTKLDVDAFSTPAWEKSAQGVAAVSGDPVLPQRKPATGRAGDLAVLAAASERDLPGILRAARGNFVFIKYDAAFRSLVLTTDRMGARPLYWYRTPSCVVFAGAKRLIVGLPGSDVRADVQGLVESACLGVPLGERTELAGVHFVQSGRIFRVRNADIAVDTYWDWCRDAPTPAPAETQEIRRELFEVFRDATTLRMGAGRSAFAALSGGLDSRTVVGALTDVGVEVTTMNVSWPSTLDQILARDFAAALGTRHLEMVLPYGEDGRDILPKCWDLMTQHADTVRALGGQTRQYWGGNDGSISVGYVYISRETVAALRANDLAQAARRFCGEMGMVLSRRVLRAPFSEYPADYPALAVAAALGKVDFPDPGHRLYMFLLMNHQRRMLAPHLEEVDIYPCEQVEPYFDTEFLRFACSLPIDASIGHGLYHRWLSEFQPAVASISWQVYPGHDPCPVRLPQGSVSQWDTIREHVAPLARSKQLASVAALLRDWRPVSQVLDRSRLLALYVGQRLRLLDASTTLQQALKLADHLRTVEGRVA